MATIRGGWCSGLVSLAIALQACATADSSLGPQPDAPPAPDAALDGTPDGAIEDAPDATPDSSLDAAADAGPGDACANAQNITAAASQPGGTTIVGDTTGGVDNVLTPSECTSYAADGPDDVYAITVIVGDRVAITLTPTTSWDPSLELVAGCGAVACVAGQDEAFGGSPESLTHTFTAAGTYYVVADGYNPGIAGPYTLAVTITHP